MGCTHAFIESLNRGIMEMASRHSFIPQSINKMYKIFQMQMKVRGWSEEDAERGNIQIIQILNMVFNASFQPILVSRINEAAHTLCRPKGENEHYQCTFQKKTTMKW